MNTYIAKIIFNIQIGDNTSQIQFDEQLRVINATTANDAFFKAKLIGKNQEDSFVNDKGQTVTWKFIDVMELQPVSGFNHGQEIYSTISEHTQPEDYINFIQQKSQFIQLQHTAWV